MMRWQLILQMLRREVTRYLSFNTFFTINLALGLVGLIMINSLQDSITIYLEGNLRNNFGGDIAIRSSEPFTQKELKLIEQSRSEFAEESQKISFFSMLNSAQSARLVNIVAIDANYPLYGDLSLFSGKGIADAFSTPIKSATTGASTQNTQENTHIPNIWMLPNTRQSLGLQMGDIVSIVDKQYRVGEDIHPNSSANDLSFSFAPIIYVQVEHLDYSYLNTRGSRVFYERIFKLVQRDNSQNIAADIRTHFDQQFGDETVPKVRTYISANSRISNLLTQASSYLSMFALIALFLAGIGATYLYRGSLTQRFMQMAIMNSLGVNKREIYTIYILHSILLGTFATLLALLCAFVLLPVFNQFLSALNVANLSLHLTAKSVIIASLTGVLGSLSFCYPAIQQIARVNAQSLLKFGSDIENQQQGVSVWKRIISYISVCFFIFLISIYQTSLSEGVFFLLTFAVVLCSIGAVAGLLMKWCDKLSTERSIYLKIALRNIVRHRWGSIVTFSVLGLGAFLLTIVPQIYQGLQNEIDASGQFNVPSLFLFDIQPEQVKPLKSLISSQQQELLSITPMVRGRLKKIDGKAPAPRRFERGQALSRSEAENRQNRNLFRGVNITYRAHTLSAESIYKGDALSPQYEGLGNKENPIQVSIEERFAKRLNISLDSLLEFSIQGIEVYGRVKNVRKVKWNSFSPNFFIVMQPGLLEDAPQTYLATIGKTSLQQRIELQQNISQQFSNISLIDVSDLVTKIIDISGKITLAVTVIAIFAILVGFMVIYSISYAEAKQKRHEMNLLKVLGGSKKSIYSIFMLEFGLISLFASLLGILMSVIATALYSNYLFENIWHIETEIIMLSFILLNTLTISLTLISARTTLNQKAELQ